MWPAACALLAWLLLEWRVGGAPACADDEPGLCPELTHFCPVRSNTHWALMNNMCRKSCNCCAGWCAACTPSMTKEEVRAGLDALVKAANQRTNSGLSNKKPAPLYNNYVYWNSWYGLPYAWYGWK